jgi:hypothetical protein
MIFQVLSFCPALHMDTVSNVHPTLVNALCLPSYQHKANGTARSFKLLCFSFIPNGSSDAGLDRLSPRKIREMRIHKKTVD